jgi:hypothetical protein
MPYKMFKLNMLTVRENIELVIIFEEYCVNKYLHKNEKNQA